MSYKMMQWLGLWTGLIFIPLFMAYAKYQNEPNPNNLPLFSRDQAAFKFFFFF